MNKMARKGWIKLHRNFLEWEHFGEPGVVTVFISLLLTADHKTGVSNLSLRGLQSATGFGRPFIVKALWKLETSGEISREKNGNVSITKITNFKEYQGGNRQLPPKPESGNRELPPKPESGNRQLPPKPESGNRELPPTPLYIKQESTKESENAHTRANAKVLDDFLNGGISLEAFCKNNRITPDECRRLAEAIVNEWDISGRQHLNDSDAKEHLMALIRNRHKEQSNGNNSNNDEPNGPNPLDRARVITVRV